MILVGWSAFSDFIANWPILSFPEALVLYLGMIRAGFCGSRRRALICICLPGIFLMSVWLIAFDGDFYDFLLLSLFFIPTNVLVPLVVCFYVVQPFVGPDSRRELAANFNFFASGLVLVFYIYDQMVVFANPSVS
jgi:hypothetical protein